MITDPEPNKLTMELSSMEEHRAFKKAYETNNAKDIADQPTFEEGAVVAALASLANNETFLEQIAIKLRAFDARHAAKIDPHTHLLADKYKELNKARNRLCEETEVASRAARQSLDKLTAILDATAKIVAGKDIEKTIELVERLAKAMTTLDEMQRSGRLDKVVLAIAGAV